MSWLWISFLLAANAGAKEVRVTFNELKALVETQNERVRAASEELAAARSREGHLGRSFLPKLEAHAAQESIKIGTQDVKTQPDYGAEVRMNLYNGGRDSLRDKALGFRSQRKTFEARGRVVEELGKSRVLYWTIVYQKNVVATLKEMIAINAENLRAAEKRIRGGVATESDRLEFEMNAIDLKRELSEAELEIRSLSRELLVHIGANADDTLVTDSVLSHGGEWEHEVRHTHRDHDFLVKPYEFASLEAQTAAREQGRAWLPRLDAYAGWNQFNQREENFAAARDRQESVVGVRLKIDAFDGLSFRREAQALRREAEAANLIATYQRKQNEAHIEKEYDELTFLHDRVHEADENIKSAERYYRVTRSEYSRGVKNSPDVLGASEKLLAMKLKRLAMIRDFQFARSHVLTKIGR